MLKYMQKIFQRVENLWNAQYEEHDELQNELAGMITSVAEGADTVYALKKTIEKLDDLNKHYKRALLMANNITAAMYVDESINNITSKGLQPIRTEYCIATLKTKTAIKIPSKKKDPEGYAKLMNAMDIPPRLWEGEFTCVAPHYLGMMELYTDGLEKGIDHLKGWEPEKEYEIYEFTTRKKSGID